MGALFYVERERAAAALCFASLPSKIDLSFSVFFFCLSLIFSFVVFFVVRLKLEGVLIFLLRQNIRNCVGAGT